MGLLIQGARCVTNRLVTLHRTNLEALILHRQLKSPSQVVPLKQREFVTLKRVLTFKPRYKQDGVEESYQLVYENAQTPLLTASRAVATLGGIIGASATSWHLHSSWDQLQAWETSALFFAAGFSIIAAGAINIMTSIHFSRIYYLEGAGRWIGIYRSPWGHQKQIKYCLRDVKSPPPSNTNEKLKTSGGKATHLKSIIRIKNSTFHLRSAYFILPKYYNDHLKTL